MSDKKPTNEIPGVKVDRTDVGCFTLTFDKNYFTENDVFIADKLPFKFEVMSNPTRKRSKRFLQFITLGIYKAPYEYTVKPMEKPVMPGEKEIPVIVTFAYGYALGGCRETEFESYEKAIEWLQSNGKKLERSSEESFMWFEHNNYEMTPVSIKKKWKP